MWHGGGWFAYMRSGDEKPKVTRDLLVRVLSYARGYWWHIAGMLITILLTTGLSLLTPLILRRHDRRGDPDQKYEWAAAAQPGVAADPGGDRRGQRHPAAAECDGGRGRHLRSAFVAFCAAATHVPALLYQYQGWRADVAAQQRCGRCAECHQQHPRRHCDQCDRNHRPAGGHARPRVAPDAGQRAHPAAIHHGGQKARNGPA